MIINLKKAAIAGLKWTTIGTIGSSLFQLLQISILTRFLPKEAFGLIAMALFVINFTTIFVDLGFTSAILHRKNATNKEYSSIYWLNLAISLFLYLIVLTLTSKISIFYNEAELKNIIPILSTNLIIMASGRVHRTIMQKEFRFKHISIVELFSYLCGLITSYILAIKGLGVYSLVYSTLTASIISNFLFLILNIREHKIYFYYSFKYTTPYLKVGSYAMGSQLVSFFSTDIDILIIGKLLGPGPLGLYSLAKQIVLKLYSIINPIITKVLSPFLSEMQSDKKSLKSYFLKITNILASFNIPIYLLIAVLSEEILIIIYGLEYKEAAIILSSLSIAYCTFSIGNPIGSLQIATGRTDLGLKWSIFSVAITPIFIYSASFLGINAVAISRAILSILIIIPMWKIQIKPMANISLKEYMNQFLVPYILLLSITGLYFIIFHYYELRFEVLENALIKGLGFGILFLGLIWIFEKQRIISLYNLIISQITTNKTF